MGLVSDPFPVGHSLVPPRIGGGARLIARVRELFRLNFFENRLGFCLRLRIFSPRCQRLISDMKRGRLVKPPPRFSTIGYLFVIVLTDSFSGVSLFGAALGWLLWGLRRRLRRHEPHFPQCWGVSGSDPVVYEPHIPRQVIIEPGSDFCG